MSATFKSETEQKDNSPLEIPTVCVEKHKTEVGREDGEEGKYKHIQRGFIYPENQKSQSQEGSNYDTVINYNIQLLNKELDKVTSLRY